MTPLFRVKHKEAGDFIDERWKDDARHLEDHLLIGPTGRVFWLQWDGMKELTNEVEVIWTEREDVARMVESAYREAAIRFLGAHELVDSWREESAARKRLEGGR